MISKDCIQKIEFFEKRIEELTRIIIYSYELFYTNKYNYHNANDAIHDNLRNGLYCSYQLRKLYENINHQR